MNDQWKLGFLGVGNMGSALASGVIAAGLLEPANIWIYDIDSGKTAKLAEENGVRIAESPAHLISEIDVAVLASKPQDMHRLLDGIVPAARARQLFISIAAGIRIGVLMERLGTDARVIRVMPNTPAMIGCGAAGVSAGPNATAEDVRRAMDIFSAVGVAVEVDEGDLDAVTGLSGSGPAYVFHLAEAMEQAGERVGLSPAAAATLARQTVLGAARMMMESGEDPGELRRRVTSPNGTTEAGLRAMREGNFAELIESAVVAATERSRELGKMFD